MTDVRSRNEAVVRALYDAERRRDINAWSALWADDARQAFQLANPQAAVAGKAELVRVTTQKFAERPPYEIHDEVEALTDASRVFARLRLHVPGHDITAYVWCLITVDDGGLITLLEEISDTAPRV